jgi:protein-S-isoprenylcysteine O-methyltransferase Ste14
VTSGPYSFVRHPYYGAIIILLASGALLLGSWLGLAAAIVPVGLIILRTALEDRELHRSLEGYRAYAERVRYRPILLVCLLRLHACQRG